MITFAHESGSGTAGLNRCPGGVAFAIRANESVRATMYENRWRFGAVARAGSVTVPTPPASVTSSISTLTCPSITIDPNTLQVGSLYRLVTDFEFVHATGTTPNIQVTVDVNGAGSFAVSITPINTAGTYYGRIDALVRCHAIIGSSGGLRATWVTPNNFSTVMPAAAGKANFTVNTTTAVTLALLLRMSSNVASNTLEILNAYAEQVA